MAVPDLPLVPDALARRNLVLARQQHATTPQQRVRGLLLRLLAQFPVPVQPGNPDTILLIRPDHLGDVLLTTPALQALRAARPAARLIALVGPWSAAVLRADDAIDEVHTLAFPGFARGAVQASLNPYRLAWERGRWLRRLEAGAAVIFRPDHWWGALLAQRAGIPWRVGYALPDVTLFLTQRVPFAPGRHAVESSLRLVEGWTGVLDPAAIRLRYPVQEAEREAIAALLAAQGLASESLASGEPYFAVHPGSGTAIKQWAAEKWAQVADQLAAQWQVAVVFTGGPGEADLIAGIMAMMNARAISVAGKTTVGTLAALYERAIAVLGPDSGPLHVAAAVGAPTVTLYGPADPAEFGPWGDPARHAIITTDIACRPCRILDWPDDDPAYHPCVRAITVAAVVLAAREAANCSLQ